MSETTKSTLVKVETGTIDLVLVNGHVPFLQFNCSCIDALPYCHGICCKQQQHFSVALTDEEAERLGCRIKEQMAGLDDLVVISVKEDKPNECRYLEGDLCSIHETKPQACKEWHCSPGGVGENIKVRAQGWVLVPTQA